MSGRPRKPSALRSLEGGRGKSRPLTPDLPAPSTTLVAPHGLTKPERAEWDRHVEWLRALKLETDVDTRTVLSMVRLVCRAQKADRVLARKGLTYEVGGRIWARPECNVSLQAWRQYALLAGQFGMTPAARAKLNVTPTKPAGAADVPDELRDPPGANAAGA